MVIKAISLWQPWAEAMRLKLKKNETRSWPTNYRGWLAIHAAKNRSEPVPRSFGVIPYGAVVCIVKLVGCEPTERIGSLVSDQEAEWGDYSNGRYAWTTDPCRMIELPQPIPLRGRQGLFDWEPPGEIEDLIAKVSAGENG